MRTVSQTTAVGLVTLRIADSFFTRLQGLLFSKELESQEAILISPCASIHTFGMKYAIHVIFLDKEGKVLAVSYDVKPNRICLGPKNAFNVIEMSATSNEIPLDIIGKIFL